MARSTVLEDIVKITSEIPWWLSIAIGGGGFYFLKYYMPSQMSGTLSPVWGPMYSMFAYLLLGACLVGVAVGLARRLRDSRIFQKQTSLQSIRSLSWADFERLVTEAFRRQGHDARRTPSGPDGGVDIVLTKSGLTTLVQCKQWKQTTIGVKPVRELAGVVAAHTADAGVFVCSGRYTSDAIEFAKVSNIDLVDGPRLLSMIKSGTEAELHGNNDRPEPSLLCPKCGCNLVRRMARKGKNAGVEFFGCSAFPKCRYTRGTDESHPNGKRIVGQER